MFAKIVVGELNSVEPQLLRGDCRIEERVEGVVLLGLLQLVCVSPANRWSCAFVPTDGKSTFVSTPSTLKIFASPIPDSSRSCGDLIALVDTETL